MTTHPLPPVPPQRPHRWEFGEQAWEDPYAWLENPENPEVIAHLEAENAYRETVMAPTAGLQETLYQEMVGRIKETDRTVPVRHGDWVYALRTEAGLQHPILIRQRAGHAGDAGSEEVLLDLNQMVGPSGFIKLLRWLPSPDQRYLAYRLNETGGIEGTIHFLDLTTGETLAERLEPAGMGMAWTNDGTALLWTRQQPDSLRSF